MITRYKSTCDVINRFLYLGGYVKEYVYSNNGLLPIEINSYYNIDDYIEAKSKITLPNKRREFSFVHCDHEYDLTFFLDGKIEMIMKKY